ncbi:MAG: HAD family hydrolase [bacterium]|nr:HAD family hydrolase [bacterium]
MIPSFNPSDRVLALDFDHNCYDTEAFLLFEIRQRMLEKWNIPVDAWQEAYETAANTGYSLEAHRDELIKILKHEPFSLSDIQEFEKQMNFSKYLYPDVLPLLIKAKEKGYKTMLLSFGAESWQDKKVKGVGLDKLMDVIFYTKEHGGKVDVLKNYAEDCAKVIFVDNSGRELDEVKKELQKVETYFMNRVPIEAMQTDDEFVKMRFNESRKIAIRQAVFEHTRVTTFNEIEL